MGGQLLRTWVGRAAVVALMSLMAGCSAANSAPSAGIAGQSTSLATYSGTSGTVSSAPRGVLTSRSAVADAHVGVTSSAAGRPSPLPSATPFTYVDDGIHVMPAAVRERAAMLLAEWDAAPRSSQVTPVPQHYQDPQGSAVIDSAATIGRNLRVTFLGGRGTDATLCGESYYPTTVESTSTVVVYLVKVNGPFPTGPNAGCGGVAIERSVLVSLRDPLSDRKIIDLITGLPVTRT